MPRRAWTSPSGSSGNDRNGAGRGCQAVLPAFLCPLTGGKRPDSSHPLACEPGICYPPDREEAKAMKPHIVTEDMRLRAGTGRSWRESCICPGMASSPGWWSRSTAPAHRPATPSGTGETGPRTASAASLGRSLPAGDWASSVTAPAGAPRGSGSTLLPSGPGGLPLLHPSDLCGRPGGLDRPPSGPPPLCWGGAPAAGVERGDHDRSGCGCRGSGTPGRTAAGGLRQRDHGGGPGLAAAGAGAVHHALPVF